MINEDFVLLVLMVIGIIAVALIFSRILWPMVLDARRRKCLGEAALERERYHRFTHPPVTGSSVQPQRWVPPQLNPPPAMYGRKRGGRR